MEILTELIWPAGRKFTRKRKKKAGLARHWTEAVGQLITICKKRDIAILYISRDTELPWQVAVSVEFRTRDGKPQLAVCDRYMTRSANLLSIAQFLEYEYKAMRLGVVIGDYKPENMRS